MARLSLVSLSQLFMMEWRARRRALAGGLLSERRVDWAARELEDRAMGRFRTFISVRASAIRGLNLSVEAVSSFSLSRISLLSSVLNATLNPIPRRAILA